MDSVDIYHGLSGQSGNVHGHSGQSSMSPWTKSIETSQTGQRPWIQWTLSMDSVDIVHGLNGQSRHCPWTPCPGGLDNVHEQCPLSPLSDWTLSMNSLDFVQSDLVN